MLDLTRQAGIVDTKRLSRSSITLVGAGSVGSFTALTLSKMGVGSIEVFDEDGVGSHNIPNQFFRKEDVDKYKVEALCELIDAFADTDTTPWMAWYKNQPLRECVIVAPDSMATRKQVWQAFQKQPQCKVLIEARMGAQLGQVYTISKDSSGQLTPSDKKFYQETLYSDESAPPVKCTEKTIIYNVLMIASLICRSYKGILSGERVPRELTFSLVELLPTSWMVRS